MGRRNQHSRDEQREMALEAVEALIARDGLAGASMRRVAQSMGYTVGTLYLLFESQDALLAAVSERTADALLAHLRSRAQARRDPLARMRAIAHGYIEFAQREAARWRLMFEHRLPPGAAAEPALQARQQALFGFVQQNLAPLLPGAAPAALHAGATALWSSVHGLCVLAVTGKLAWSGISDYRGLSDLVVQALIAGLASGTGVRPARARAKGMRRAKA